MRISKALKDFMKKLRPFLQGKVEPLNDLWDLGWIVDDFVIVKVEYLCLVNGDSSGKQVADCMPHSVKVYVTNGSKPHWSDSKKNIYPKNTNYRGRTYRKRQDGTVNLEGISIAVRDLLRQRKNDIEKRKAERKEEAKKLEILKSFHTKLVKVVPKAKISRYPNNHPKLNWKGMSVCISEQEQEVKVAIDLRYVMSVEEASEIINYLYEKVVQ